ncbi:MAG: hypothetical protein L3J75_14655 [Methylococcaceae bacterium]|nr:hypothetical protein [Methylococcaceae bacterium]
MPEIILERLNFIELLHDAFFNTKGYGAFAYISVTEVMDLFEQYLVSNESANLFINRFVRTI